METVVITGGALITEEMNHSGDFLFPVLKLEEANYKDLRYNTVQQAMR